jgi:tetratricopeptide (TPR) repeat protein
MLFRSFAHLLLLAFVALAMLVLVLLGMWLGWWGATAQTTLQAVLEPIVDFYSANKSAVDVCARVLGASGTALTGIFGFHKAWYYAEANLPKRLDEYIKSKRNEIIVGDRKMILADFEQDQGSVIKRLDDQQPRIDETLSLLNEAKASWQKQKATSLYCYGRQKARQAAEPPSSPAERNQSASLRAKAIEDFEQAAELDPDDLRGWEYAALQAEAIHDRRKAIELWNALAKAHDKRGDEHQQSQSLHYVARNYWERGTDPGIPVGERNWCLGQSRDLLEDTRVRLRKRQIFEWTKLRADCCELLGRVRIKLETFTAARNALNEAIEAYRSINDEQAASRVEGLIDEAQQQRPQGTDAAQTVDHPDQILARAYERLGEAFIGNEEDVTARSKARKNLHLALGYYEQIVPRPGPDIQRVEQLLSDPWLSRIS